jgi:hypothetical protein
MSRNGTSQKKHDKSKNVPTGKKSRENNRFVSLSRIRHRVYNTSIWRNSSKLCVVGKIVNNKFSSWRNNGDRIIDFSISKSRHRNIQKTYTTSNFKKMAPTVNMKECFVWRDKHGKMIRSFLYTNLSSAVSKHVTVHPSNHILPVSKSMNGGHARSSVQDLRQLDKLVIN